MRIVIETGRGPAISAHLPGPPLTIPRELRVISSGPGEMHLSLETSTMGSAPDVLVGSIPLVSWDSSNQQYDVSHIPIPPPPPFSPDDVSEMWRDVLADGPTQPRSVSGQGFDAGQAAVLSEGLRIDALKSAMAAAQRLLSEWPSREQAEVIWRSPEIPGVRIDGRATDRAAGRFAGYAAPDGRLMPARVAGRRVGSLPWRARTLAGAALALRDAVTRLPALNHSVSRPATMVLERVAMAARSETTGPDPPVSAWPRLAAQAFRAFLSALIELTASAPGDDAVPLTDLWRLYEAWVALQVSRELVSRFGQGITIGTARTWSTADYAVTMTLQCTIGAAAMAVPPAPWSRPVRSVSSDLIPDILVAVQGPNGRSLIVIETKQRTAGTAMDASAVAEAASKYTWGIRDAADEGVLAVGHVLVVSSARIDKVMHSASAARISSSWLLPGGRGDGTLPRRLNAALTEALTVAR